MKLKGINPFEHHVEKIVLGVLSVAALAVVASQFLFEPNKVTVGQGEPVAPDAAYGPVEKAADSLLGQVNSKSPALPEVPKVDILQRFKDRLSGNVAPRPEIVPLGPRISFGEDRGGTSDSGGEIAGLLIPAPAIPAARSFAGTIDPLEVALAPELAAILPKEQPFDKFAVSVETVFDGTALRSALSADPDGEAGPQKSIPMGWWRDAVEIVGIELEREQLLSTGEWSGAKVISGLPARLDLLGQVQKNVKSSGDIPAVLEQARQNASEILTPEFYNMIAGVPWTPPTEAQLVAAGPGTRIDQIQKRLNTLDEDIERIQRQLARNTDRSNQPARPAQGGREGKGMTEAEQARQNDPRLGGGRQRANQPTQQDTKKVPKTPLERKQDERDRLAAELETLREKMEKPAAVDAAPSKPLLENPSVRVWAHDVTAEPGAQYRYRVRVVVNNPFFGREASLPATLKQAAGTPVARSDWSEWTDPVRVDDTKYYFIMSAQERDAIGNNRATADLMEFFYGFYRRASVQLEPGDPIMADVKLPPDLREFDLVKLASGARPQEQQPEAAPDDEGGGRRPAQGNRPAEPAAPKAEAAADPDAVAKPLKQKLETISTGAMLLDVAASPAGVAGKAGPPRVFVRDPSGTITVKSPEAQGPDSLYQRLLASAKAGETQGKPKVEPRQPKPVNQAPRPNEGPQKRGEPGDGGGGGGG